VPRSTFSCQIKLSHFEDDGGISAEADGAEADGAEADGAEADGAMAEGGT
jgi:hypothetical protein